MSTNPNLVTGPVQAGVPPEAAHRAAVLVHGRDQDEQLMLDVISRLQLDDVAYLLPVAAERTWYHGRYYDRPDDNEPELSWALEAIESSVALAINAGIELPMYVSCSRSDAWIPIEDARITAQAFAAAGADVVFDELGDREHLISDRAVRGLRRLLGER